MSTRNHVLTHARRVCCLVLLPLFMASAGNAQAWELVWADEFDGTAVDPARWELMRGDGCDLGICGWGNNELEWYQEQNVTIEDGMLVITAKEEPANGYAYTSARLRTRNKGDWTYGRVEVRARLPVGKGLWPAIWMLPTVEAYGGWAASGEIDIMEYVGDRPAEVLGTIHYGGAFPNNVFTSRTHTLSAGSFDADFHVFALEWEPGAMRWYVDGVNYATQNTWWTSGGSFPAPFDQAFHLLLNVAVGGNLPGAPDANTVFPQKMEVDYVRVYRDPNLSLADPTDDPLIFDDMEHGDPNNNGWFAFGSDIGGGGVGGDNTDLPPKNGGAFSLAAGFGGAPGFIGGFGRTHPLDLSDVDHFNFWINPDAGQSYTLEINLQDDDNGDGLIPSPSAVDDEYQYNCVVGPAGPCAVSGGGWQLVEIPFSDFFDDNSFHTGGNGLLDAVPTSAGGNGQLVNVVVAVIGTGTDVNFRTDFWVFTRGALSTGVEGTELPEGYALHQNYPNPFNPATTISFDLAAPGAVHLSVFNVLGQRVVSLVDGKRMGAGHHGVPFLAEGLVSGVYLYRLEVGDVVATRRMVLLK